MTQSTTKECFSCYTIEKDLHEVAYYDSDKDLYLCYDCLREMTGSSIYDARLKSYRRYKKLNRILK